MANVEMGSSRNVIIRHMTPDANNDRNCHELIRNFFGKLNNMLWNEPEMHLKNKQVVDTTFGEKDQRQQAHS